MNKETKEQKQQLLTNNKTSLQIDVKLNSLSKKFGLKTPLADTVYKIVGGKISPKTGMENFLKNLK